MNRYDALPASAKLISLVTGMVPVAVVWWSSGSWKLALAAFALGFLIGWPLRLAAGYACKAKHNKTGSDAEMAAFHECFAWRFLYLGPVGYAAAAIAVMAMTGTL